MLLGRLLGHVQHVRPASLAPASNCSSTHMHADSHASSMHSKHLADLSMSTHAFAYTLLTLT